MRLHTPKLITGIIFAVLFTAFLPINGHIFAERSQEIEQKIQVTEKDLNKLTGESEQLLHELSEVHAKLLEKEDNITSTTENLLKKESEIETIESEIDSLESEIKAIQERISLREEIIKNRLSSLQKNGGNISYLEVIFGSENFGDFISRLSSVTTIMNQDNAIILAQDADKTSLENSQFKLADDRTSLANEYDRLAEEQAHLVAQKQEFNALESDLQAQITENELTVAHLEASQTKLSKELEEEKAEISTLAQFTPSLTSSNDGIAQPNNRQDAQFIWPTIGGTVTSYQGMRWGSYHKGIDIARPTDYSILAADKGEITFTGWINGYGNTIKINHQNGYTTQYAHLASISVRNGQTVSKGETIGIMGTTGRSTGIHLDFEVYYNEQLINPIDVLP